MVSVDVAVVGVVSVVDVFIHLRCSDICEWAVRRSLWRVLCGVFSVGFQKLSVRASVSHLLSNRLLCLQLQRSCGEMPTALRWTCGRWA